MPPPFWKYLLIMAFYAAVGFVTGFIIPFGVNLIRGSGFAVAFSPRMIRLAFFTATFMALVCFFVSVYLVVITRAAWRQAVIAMKNGDIADKNETSADRTDAPQSR